MQQLSVSLVLAFASGAAALAHQLVWTRRLVDVLGASADTFSKVIGAFFVGLAFGAWLAARFPGGTAPWRRVALAEFAVATLALPMLFSVVWFGRVFFPGMKIVLPVLLVTPPAIAMGLVVPWMVRALSGEDAFRPRHAVWLYAGNTLGGIAGIVFVVFEGLPRFGLNGAAVFAVCLNIAVGLGALVLARKPQTRIVETQPAASTTPILPLRSLLAFMSGFLVLALEVVLQHQLAQVTINSLFSSALVLVFVLLALGVAAVLASLLMQWLGSEYRVLAWGFLAAAILCAVQPFVVTGLRDGLNILPYELPPLAYTAEVAKLGLLAAFPLFVAAGLVFPVLLRSVATLGTREVGMLFAWNGLGGWLGAEISQSLLAPRLGLWHSVGAIGAVYLCLCVAHGWGNGGRTRWMPICASAAIVLGACIWVTRTLPQAKVESHERLVALQAGREGVVATLECGPDDWRMLFNNSYTLGGSKAQYNQERQGLLPLLFHGQPRAIATLGVATGGTVAGVTMHPEIHSVDAIELSPLVLRYARDYFGAYNRGVFRDSRVRFIAEDARWVVSRRPDAYDVVVGDLFLPWRTGEARLFTLEHFENVRASLRPGGLFCQWLPLFQLTRPQFEAIARTFRAVFPDAFLVRGDFYAEQPILGLVGGKDLARVDWNAVEQACERVRDQDKLKDPLLRHAEGVAMLVIGPLGDPRPGPLNTLANGWVEWDAGRNILGMRTPWFIGIPCAEYVRDVQRAGQSAIPERLRDAHTAGQFFLTLEIAARLNLPAFNELKAQIIERTPRSLLDDEAARWEQWPMRVKPKTTDGAAKAPTL